MAAYETFTLLPRQKAVLTTDGVSSGFYYQQPYRSYAVVPVPINTIMEIGPVVGVEEFRVVSETGVILVTFVGSDPGPSPGFITNSQSSTAVDGTLEDVTGPGGFADAAATERNFSELADKYNQLILQLIAKGILD